MAGRLYGVGVGPGDSKLLTLKAKEILESVDVIAVPVKASGEESRALSIVRPVVDLKYKEIMPVVFKMEHSVEKRAECRKQAAEQLMEQMDSGKDVAMIVLGDISVYSTYHLAFKYIREKGMLQKIFREFLLFRRRRPGTDQSGGGKSKYDGHIFSKRYREPKRCFKNL